MTALNINLPWTRDDDRRPQELSRIMAVLVVILAVVNVSTAVLMFRSWATMTHGVLELERTMSNPLAENGLAWPSSSPQGEDDGA